MSYPSITMLVGFFSDQPHRCTLKKDLFEVFSPERSLKRLCRHLSCGLKIFQTILQTFPDS